MFTPPIITTLSTLAAKNIAKIIYLIALKDLFFIFPPVSISINKQRTAQNGPSLSGKAIYNDFKVFQDISKVL